MVVLGRMLTVGKFNAKTNKSRHSYNLECASRYARVY